jgi:hypothetical protein
MGLRGNRELKAASQWKATSKSFKPRVLRAGAAVLRRPAGPWLIEGFAVFSREAVSTRVPSRCMLIEATYPLHAEAFPQGVICLRRFFTRGCQTLKIVNVDEREST